MTKYIFVTGGVVSSLGKGITAASLGRLLKSRGLKVAIQKFDPYINPDPGTLTPYQHGEVFVTEDGAETDLDLGHYERFVDINLNRKASTSMGAIYRYILEKERHGGFDGKTVQVIPHITNEIQSRMLALGESGDLDIVITEIGGTVGDIESLPYLETLRQLRQVLGRENSLYIHLTLVPYISVAGEAKTKPTQHSVKELRSIGIQPDIIVCRSDYELPQETKDKIALFCDIDKEAVIECHDVANIFEIPLMLMEQNFDQIVCDKLNIKAAAPQMDDWKALCEKISKIDKEMNVALVGKYVELPDAYLSFSEAIRHAAIANDVKLNVKWINATLLTKENIEEELKGMSGILVPSGFGVRGAEGMALASQYARENDIPFFAEGMGMHMAAYDYATNVAGLTNLDCEKDLDTPNSNFLEAWSDAASDLDRLGGTLCVGARDVKLVEGTMAAKIYGTTEISERFRHRYQLKADIAKVLVDNGMVVSGYEEGTNVPEVLELPGKKCFIGCQFHPEFKSRPAKPHPLFDTFVKAVLATEEN